MARLWATLPQQKQVPVNLCLMLLVPFLPLLPFLLRTSCQRHRYHWQQKKWSILSMYGGWPLFFRGIKLLIFPNKAAMLPFHFESSSPINVVSYARLARFRHLPCTHDFSLEGRLLTHCMHAQYICNTGDKARIHK